MQSSDYYSKDFSWTFQVVQWLRICASNAGGTGSIPGWHGMRKSYTSGDGSELGFHTQESMQRTSLHPDGSLPPDSLCPPWSLGPPSRGCPADVTDTGRGSGSSQGHPEPTRGCHGWVHGAGLLRGSAGRPGPGAAKLCLSVEFQLSYFKS